MVAVIAVCLAVMFHIGYHIVPLYALIVASGTQDPREALQMIKESKRVSREPHEKGIVGCAGVPCRFNASHLLCRDSAACGPVAMAMVERQPDAQPGAARKRHRRVRARRKIAC